MFITPVRLLAVALVVVLGAPLAPISDAAPAGDGAILARVEMDVDFSQLDVLNRLGVDVDAVFDGWARVYVTAEELQKLRARGLAVTVKHNPAPQMAELAQQQAEAGAETQRGSVPAVYHTYATLTTDLQQIAADHPGIVRLTSIGQTVQGREMWMVKITDNPDVEENEPEVAYISSMHGDEVVGKELCFNFINHLTDNYGTDPRVTALVDDHEIWIMPSMNPDGTESGQRWNANGRDLNRNFPDQFVDPSNDTSGREPETAAVMNWRAGTSINLSANFHGGALVANYPFDSTPSGSSSFYPTPDPDHTTFQSIARTYADANLPMSTSNSHPAWDDGITNGSDWYAINGGMQDWQYVWYGDFDLTLEVSNNKWPAASTLPGFWDDNLESMLAYLERVDDGIHGTVTDQDGGAPIAASIQVDSNGYPAYTDPDVGDFHRVVPPGTYSLTVSAMGYETKVVPNVVVAAGAPALVDVTLGPQPVDLQPVGMAVLDLAEGFLDPGETSDLAVEMQNLGRSATGVKARLIPTGWFSQVTRESADYPDIPLGGTGTSIVPNYEVWLDPAIPAGQRVGYALTWEANEGTGTSEPFFLEIGQPVQQNAASMQVPVSIPTLPVPVIVQSTLDVVDPMTLTGLTVTVDISHTYLADIAVTLRSPQGTLVRLHANGGGSADDIVGTYGVDLTPVDSLDAFVGESPVGTWTLEVTDTGLGGGTINGWSLDLTGRQGETVTPQMLFRELAREDGTGLVRLEWWAYPDLTFYRVYRSTDPSSASGFVEVTSEDPDATDTLFFDASTDPLVFYLVTGVGPNGEGPKGHFGE